MAKHEDVLKRLISTPWGLDYKPELVTEAYGVMVKFAPLLATVPALAGHWVKAMLVQTFIGVCDIEQLCGAEIAARETVEEDAMHDLRYEAFVAGAEAAMPYLRTNHDSFDFDITTAFEAWCEKEDK